MMLVLVIFHVVVVFPRDADLSKFSDILLGKASPHRGDVTEEECPRKHQITPKRWRSRNEAKARERWMCLCETLWVRFASYRSCSQIRKFLCLCPLSSTSMSKGEGIAGAENKMLGINSGPIFYLWNDWSVKNVSHIRSGNKERVLKAKLIFPN